MWRPGDEWTADLRVFRDRVETTAYYYIIPRDDEANVFSTFTTAPNANNVTSPIQDNNLGVDYREVYVASQMLRIGWNPYEAERYVYPPLAALVNVPATYVPFGIVKYVVSLAVLASAAQRYQANDNTTGDGLNTGGYRFNAPLPVRLGAHTLRLDFKLNDSHNFFARGNYQNDTAVTGQEFPDTLPRSTWSHPKAFAVGHIWTVNPRLINDLRFGLTRDSFTDQGDSTVNAVTFRSVFSDSVYIRSFSRVTPVYNITDNVNWRPTGSHSFDFGGNIRLLFGHQRAGGANEARDRPLDGGCWRRGDNNGGGGGILAFGITRRARRESERSGKQRGGQKRLRGSA